MLDIVLASTAAFGAGSHPTTRTCLELLLGCEPVGSFADLGCGTGVLSILAAQLGWRPVVAVDLQRGSVAAARGTRRQRGGDRGRGRRPDRAAAPPSDAIAANLPGAPSADCRRAPRSATRGAAERFRPRTHRRVLAAYAAPGPVRRTAEPHGWSSGARTRLTDDLRGCRGATLRRTARTTIRGSGMAEYIRFRLTVAKAGVTMALLGLIAGSPTGHTRHRSATAGKSEPLGRAEARRARPAIEPEPRDDRAEAGQR